MVWGMFNPVLSCPIPSRPVLCRPASCCCPVSAVVPFRYRQVCFSPLGFALFGWVGSCSILLRSALVLSPDSVAVCCVLSWSVWFCSCSVPLVCLALFKLRTLSLLRSAAFYLGLLVLFMFRALALFGSLHVPCPCSVWFCSNSVPLLCCGLLCPVLVCLVLFCSVSVRSTPFRHLLSCPAPFLVISQHTSQTCSHRTPLDRAQMSQFAPTNRPSCSSHDGLARRPHAHRPFNPTGGTLLLVLRHGF
ncbi:hypothetical protein BU24DRAFT_139751 [Aaosphaeria arxii CBS 175.79]|uniref:Uncharacterized protein n=1 Tax=Aaosphaeria arxii CBS 175.79 TaxID=1450172 RepID=A0A6A5XU23_9PLEO|nr:uncharacterized protein BU24DRAFT_139751 [Aaosphaeria arxii CBS 175.79]KAF2016855.1 hypothetical protein BU24DRAFT_139751 [Aaosphaeria arxii CBS 175.79]